MGEITTYSVFIPNWRPASLNELMGGSVRNKIRRKKADRKIITFYCCRLPKATAKRHVSLHIVLTGRQQEADPDAYYKSLLDGLVKCGMLVDDKGEYCSYGMPTYSRGTKEQAGTHITLEDIA
jgi:hypothetical protein